MSESFVDKEAVKAVLIALDLTAIFSCTVISKKGLSYSVTVGQMETHYISLRGFACCLETISKASLKNFNQLTTIMTISQLETSAQ